jgi:AbrB family looped-hinge helix DNA binding protein
MRIPVVSQFVATAAFRWYIYGMRTTIDKAGRVVIPAAVRDKAGLSPGSELEITTDDLGIRLERVAPGPRLVKVGRRLVARPTVGAAHPEHRKDVDVTCQRTDRGPRPVLVSQPSRLRRPSCRQGDAFHRRRSVPRKLQRFT